MLRFHRGKSPPERVRGWTRMNGNPSGKHAPHGRLSRSGAAARLRAKADRPELIGRTPMVGLSRFGAGPGRLFVNLESRNLGGSIEDRVALGG